MTYHNVKTLTDCVTSSVYNLKVENSFQTLSNRTFVAFMVEAFLLYCNEMEDNFNT